MGRTDSTESWCWSMKAYTWAKNKHCIAFQLKVQGSQFKASFQANPWFLRSRGLIQFTLTEIIARFLDSWLCQCKLIFDQTGWVYCFSCSLGTLWVWTVSEEQELNQGPQTIMSLGRRAVSTGLLSFITSAPGLRRVIMPSEKRCQVFCSVINMSWKRTRNWGLSAWGDSLKRVSFNSSEKNEIAHHN